VTVAERSLTVEQLANETGMSVRNIRNHQSRGLLPPPEVRARVGYYGPEHVVRLRLIQQLQADGLKLSAIERVLSDRGASADHLLGLRRAVTAPFEAESPEVISRDELDERFGPLSGRQKALDKAQRLGLLVPLGEDRFEAPSPALLRAAEEAVARGVSLHAALRVVADVRSSCETMARAFVGVFERELLGGDADPVAAVEDLRPVAAQTVAALFDQAMAAEAGRALSAPTLP
jgi:DNA-binding transcriptional MerR regulator